MSLDGGCERTEEDFDLVKVPVSFMKKNHVISKPLA
jgi:hypothetical protein